MDVLKEGEEELQYLTFRIGGHVYALGLLEIREIVELETLAPLPASSEIVLGLLNLHGRALPVLDLARILGESGRPTDDPGCILVVETKLGERSVSAGLLAEEVCQVTGIGPGDLQEAPLAGTTERADYLKAIARIENTFVPILNLACVFNAPELREQTPWQSPETGEGEPAESAEGS